MAENMAEKTNYLDRSLTLPAVKKKELLYKMRNIFWTISGDSEHFDGIE